MQSIRNLLSKPLFTLLNQTVSVGQALATVAVVTIATLAYNIFSQSKPPSSSETKEKEPPKQDNHPTQVSPQDDILELELSLDESDFEENDAALNSSSENINQQSLSPADYDPMLLEVIKRANARFQPLPKRKKEIGAGNNSRENINPQPLSDADCRTRLAKALARNKVRSLKTNRETREKIEAENDTKENIYPQLISPEDYKNTLINATRIAKARSLKIPKKRQNIERQRVKKKHLHLVRAKPLPSNLSTISENEQSSPPNS